MAATAAFRETPVAEPGRSAFPPPPLSARPVDRAAWIAAFHHVRDETERRAAPLSPEDQQVQSMADASPTKWHRAHTTWFFEQFLLREHLPGYAIYDERLHYLFNSYYVAAGPRQPRIMRGLITRPTADEVAAYRAHVDRAVDALLSQASASALEAVLPGPRDRALSRAAAPGIADHRHPARLRAEPARPGLRRGLALSRGRRAPAGRAELAGASTRIGHDGRGLLLRQRIAAPRCPDPGRHPRPGPGHQRGNGSASWRMAATTRPELWLSDGWIAAQTEGWEAPGYWREAEGGWATMTLAGIQPVDPDLARHPCQLLRGRCLCPLGRA